LHPMHPNVRRPSSPDRVSEGAPVPSFGALLIQSHPELILPDGRHGRPVACRGVNRIMQSIFPATAARLEEWKAQPEVLGVLLVGSKSRGHGDELSDDDLEVLLTDAAFAGIRPADCLELHHEGEGKDRKMIYDAQYTSLSDLVRKAGSPFDLDHWPYEKAGILFDRDGRVAEAVRNAGRMLPEFRRLRLLHATIDTGIAANRVPKTLQRGAEAAARILVAEGARGLARLLFALEHRWVPLFHWLEAELKTLQDPTGAGPLLVEAVLTGRPEPLREALRGLEDRLYESGVPRPPDRLALFLELIHTSRVEERAIHGL
jgi:hypothetical protein